VRDERALMGLFSQIFSQAAGANPPADRPPQRGPQKRDPHRDGRPEQDKNKARKHYDGEAGEAERDGEQRDGRIW
jgi:hypothetical protein